MSDLSYGFAKRHGVLVRELTADQAIVAHRADVDLHSLIELRRVIGRSLQLDAVTDEVFAELLQQAYENNGRGAALMMESEEWDLARIAQALPEPEDLLEAADDAPIIRLINALLTEAIKENASDIHIEAFEHRLQVRFRVDGVLREVLSPPRALGALLVSRVKVMADLDIAEKRLPQDGRISLRVAGRPVDVRVSTLPAGHGERVVLRLLDKSAGRLDMVQLGMRAPDRKILQSLLQRPHGILLVTGPTGSGKTTTLYAALDYLNSRQHNIMTVEDPIEYYLDGISQTQVNNRVDMSFARGLRAILRQDPDVVMVGEIRDLETAEIAVQASLTGHLVLSTLHTNSAVGALTRMRDMGVEAFLLASSLIGVLAQRLVRRLCSHCKAPVPVGDAERALLGEELTAAVLYQARGCEQCGQSGYRGRIGVFELIPIDTALQSLIHDQAAEQVLERQARAHSPGLRADCRDRVLQGDTSLEEFVRITREA
jgi:general secretion pathway protein E